jgi:glutaredoxin-related protein
MVAHAIYSMASGLYFCFLEYPPMSRQLLPEDAIHPSIHDRIGGSHADTVREVIDAVHSNPVVVVGMATNPYCKKVRKQLTGAGIDFNYLEYGSYTSEWQRRLALKMWSGWPTLPMVFVGGKLVGGNEEVAKLLASGELKSLLDHV